MLLRFVAALKPGLIGEHNEKLRAGLTHSAHQPTEDILKTNEHSEAYWFRRRPCVEQGDLTAGCKFTDAIGA